MPPAHKVYRVRIVAEQDVVAEDALQAITRAAEASKDDPMNQPTYLRGTRRVVEARAEET